MGVKIRQKGKKLYLDIYVKGVRRWEALHLTLTQDKAQNKEIKRLAEMCRAKREMQVVSDEWRLLDPVRNKQTLFVYMSRVASEQEGGH